MDISTGGARIRSAVAPVRHRLVLGFHLGENEPAVIVRAELVRIESQLESGEFAWAVAFAPLAIDVQARFTRFVFHEAKSVGVAS